MKSSDSSAERSTASNALGLRIVLIACFSILIALALLGQRWVSAGFWFALMVLQLVIPKHFRGQRILKWIFLLAVCVLLVLDITSHISR